MAVFASLIATATRLIAAKGMLCTWTKTPGALGGTPWAPGQDPAQPAVYTPSIVFFPPGAYTQKTLQSLLGVEVPTSYEYGLMTGAVGFSPDLTDKVQKGTGAGIQPVMPIVKLDTIAPNGETVLYTIWFQR